jgi:hypothetical protein
MGTNTQSAWAIYLLGHQMLLSKKLKGGQDQAIDKSMVWHSYPCLLQQAFL